MKHVFSFKLFYQVNYSKLAKIKHISMLNPFITFFCFILVMSVFILLNDSNLVVFDKSGNLFNLYYDSTDFSYCS